MNKIKFPKLCFPDFDFKIKEENNNLYIFDDIRKKWILYTSEEWVRQNLIKFLTLHYKYPVSLIAIEKSLSLANRNLRFDALIYDKNINPLMIIECKAPEIKLSQNVFDQIWNYNYKINAPFFIVTNGVSFVMGSCFKGKDPEFFYEVKTYNELLSILESSAS